MSLDLVPQEILEHIAFFLSTEEICGPPAHLVSLLLTNRKINARLSTRDNPHFYAVVFAHKFDYRTAKARLGEERIDSEALTEELKRRFTVLKRFRSKKDCLAGTAPSDGCLDELLATAYLMMLEDEGRNKMQLLFYSEMDQWIKDYMLHKDGASLTRQRLENGGYPLPTTRASLAMWLFWFFIRPDEYARSRETLDTSVTVFKTLSFSAHLYNLTNTPWHEHSPDKPSKPGIIVTWYSQPLPITPPPLAIPAILSFLALVNRRKALPIAPSDSTIVSTPLDEWRAEWGRAVSSGTDEISDCFNLGSTEGVWEGFFTYTEFTAYAAMLGGGSPQQLQNSMIGRHQQTWKLAEWHLVESDEPERSEPLPWGDPLRSYFPAGVKLTISDNSLVVQGPGSDEPLLYHKAGSTKGKVVDVIITGEGHSAWGQFGLTGRVRPCDGFVSLSKDYVSPASSSPIRSMFHS
ncbi:hypothetical protein D9611_001011 [Ephemerocybe angulata]|uniref:F-box domain-containing protein n=1 Tax=Ephemerocybe angulata TaxID=980116 RepID=A0A8H5BN64_9AGAR|nr:hypothetical protein D9611_001011 [Tulosesus angulatus]